MASGGLRDRILVALKQATAAGDATRTTTLRLVAATLRDRDIGSGDGEDAPGPDDDAAVRAILTTMVRQREEAIHGLEESGRIELAAKEQAEIDVIRDYLPKPMTAAEIDAAVAAAIAETEAASLRDMGRVIGVLKARHPGRMDFARVGARVKAALA